MTTENNQTTEKKSGSTMRPVLDGILSAVRETPHRMPAGGWFGEVATNENWRTNTIVQRHRDRATSTPSSRTITFMHHARHCNPQQTPPVSTRPAAFFRIRSV